LLLWAARAFWNDALELFGPATSLTRATPPWNPAATFPSPARGCAVMRHLNLQTAKVGHNLYWYSSRGARQCESLGVRTHEQDPCSAHRRHPGRRTDCSLWDDVCDGDDPAICGRVQ